VVFFKKIFRSGTASKESDPLLRAKADVEQVRGIMQQNIEKVIERGDKIEDLQANSGKTGFLLLLLPLLCEQWILEETRGSLYGTMAQSCCHLF